MGKTNDSLISILVPLARGSEEMESMIPVDVLRRAGFHVVTTGLEPGLLTASRKTRIQPNALLD
ncbi:MAG: DJ-1/PfpI family protein [Verrucomicrobiota bacterium]